MNNLRQIDSPGATGSSGPVPAVNGPPRDVGEATVVVLDGAGSVSDIFGARLMDDEVGALVLRAVVPVSEEPGVLLSVEVGSAWELFMMDA